MAALAVGGRAGLPPKLITIIEGEGLLNDATALTTLAVAVAGLMIGHDTPRFTSGASRLQASAVWHLADFLISGFVFLLIGRQIAPVVAA